MFNPVDTRQMRALVDHRQDQLLSEASRSRTMSERDNRADRHGAGTVRVVIGRQLMHIGARIAGTGFRTGPHLRPEV